MATSTSSRSAGSSRSVGFDLEANPYSIQGLPDRHRLNFDLFEQLALQTAAIGERHLQFPHFDLQTMPKGWDGIAERYFEDKPMVRRTPLLLTAMVHRDLFGKDDKEVGGLGEMIRSCPLPAIIETNHDARLQLAAGDGIVSGHATGVGGGFLFDAQSNDIYGVTCAHVARLNSNVTDQAGQLIGLCAAASNLATNVNNLACDPLAASGAAPINDLDAALVRVSKTVPSTRLRPASTLRESQTIDVWRSGMPARRFQIRSLAISFQLLHTHGGQTDKYCFRNLVELYSRSAVTQASDSGSWGYTLGSDWAVMVVGGDPISSFAVRASHVLDWACRIAFGQHRSLSVY
jgi:hypothetical protein